MKLKDALEISDRTSDIRIFFPIIQITNKIEYILLFIFYSPIPIGSNMPNHFNRFAVLASDSDDEDCIRTMSSSVPFPKAACPPPPPVHTVAVATPPSDDLDCDCADGCMWCCPVTLETRSFWASAQQKSDELGALYAAHYPVVPFLAAESAAASKKADDFKRCAALFGKEMAEVFTRTDRGMSIYDAIHVDGDPEWDEWQAICSAQAAHRAANTELYRAAESAAQLAWQQKRIEEKVADESKARLSREKLKMGMKLEKKDCPCARLYSCVGDKSTGGARPTTSHVSSECWSHERVCPRTGDLLKPHKCPWLHPGEPGWLPQWNTDRLFKPTRAPTATLHRVAAALGGGWCTKPKRR